MPTDTTTATPEVAASAVLVALERAWTAFRARHPEIPRSSSSSAPAPRPAEAYSSGATSSSPAGRWPAPTAPKSWLPAKASSAAPARSWPRWCTRPPTAWPTRGVKDTSRQGRYHNRYYARLAAELGLQVAYNDKTGWSQTTVPDTLADLYATQLADLDAAVTLWRRAEQQTPGSTGSRNLLACTCGCGRKLRVSRAALEQARSPATPARSPSNPRTPTPLTLTSQCLNDAPNACMRSDAMETPY